MLKLVISDDEGKTTVVPLVRDEITIGRKEGNTIRLTERNVSRRHARLFKNGNGAFTIEDLGSYNGIKINGRKIGEPASLKAGDQVNIGDYLLALQVDAAESSTDTTISASASASGFPVSSTRLPTISSARSSRTRPRRTSARARSRGDRRAQTGWAARAEATARATPSAPVTGRVATTRPVRGPTTSKVLPVATAGPATAPPPGRRRPGAAG